MVLMHTWYKYQVVPFLWSELEASRGRAQVSWLHSQQPAAQMNPQQAAMQCIAASQLIVSFLFVVSIRLNWSLVIKNNWTSGGTGGWSIVCPCRGKGVTFNINFQTPVKSGKTWSWIWLIRAASGWRYNISFFVINSEYCPNNVIWDGDSNAWG